MVRGAFGSGPPIVFGAFRPLPGPVACCQIDFGLFATSPTALIALSSDQVSGKALLPNPRFGPCPGSSGPSPLRICRLIYSHTLHSVL